jgi:hypothetical protein
MQTPSLVSFTPQSLIELIRRFLRDTPKLNELRGVFESDEFDIKLYINMAISDWNNTPPLISPVGLDNFPCPNWLILAPVVYAVRSAAVQHYRNELPYNDSGITVDPWSKGNPYMKFADTLSQYVENQKRDFKYALNLASTFGVVRSPEYLVWDYAGLYTGPQFDNRGSSYQALAGTGAGTPVPDYMPPSSTAPFNFGIEAWQADVGNNVFFLIFTHGLLANVDIRITDPVAGIDLKSKMLGIQYLDQNNVKLTVSLAPDGRLAGQMIAYKI